MRSDGKAKGKPRRRLLMYKRASDPWTEATTYGMGDMRSCTGAIDGSCPVCAGMLDPHRQAMLDRVVRTADHRPRKGGGTLHGRPTGMHWWTRQAIIAGALLLCLAAAPVHADDWQGHDGIAPHGWSGKPAPTGHERWEPHDPRGNGAVVLAWEYDDGDVPAAGFQIQIGELPSVYVQVVRIDDPAARSWTVTDLDNAKTYYFALNAVSAANDSSYLSNEVAATP